MSTYVLMKILESAPGRYDRGIRLLSLGKIDGAYRRLTAAIQPGQMVLDIGCGTGALTILTAQKGARVKGIDTNPQMLEIARQRINEQHLSEQVELAEMGVAELGNEPANHYDVVISGFCFSELSPEELNYTLPEVNRILKPGGLLLLADEVRPQNRLKRLVNFLFRFPLVILTYLISQTTTHALTDLPEKIEMAGFRIQSCRLNSLENFIEIVATKSGKPNE